ncbi:MAG: hypothetical protein ACOY3Y_04780 [Acidobacteriota bacterium]
MRRMNWTAGILAVAVLAALGAGAASSPGAAARAPKATCTFSNPAHAGDCVEVTEVAEDSTPHDACVAILNCLNDARCVKVYCNATNVRQGWKLKAAEPLEE